MKKIVLPVIFIVCFLFANSQNPDSVTVTFALNEVVVKASNFVGNKLPVTYNNIHFETLQYRYTGSEPSYMISTLPSVTVVSDAGNYFGYSYLRIRGIDQTRINFSIDGVPLNEPEDQGVYFSNYPNFFNSLQNVQFQRGSGTSKQGISSFAGSLQLNSVSLDSGFNLSAGASYGSFNSYRLFAKAKWASSNKGLFVNVSKVHSDGYKNRSAHSGQSAFYKAFINLSKHQISLTGFTGKQQNQLAWIGVPMNEIIQNPKQNANSSENDNFVQSLTYITHQYTLNSNILLKTVVFYNYLHGGYDFDLNNFIALPLTDEMYRYQFKSNFSGINSQIEAKFNFLKLEAGVHANTYNRNHVGSERALGRLYTNTGYRHTLSGFVRLAAQLQSIVMFADVQLRYTDFIYKGSVAINNPDWFFVNGLSGFLYKVNHKMSFYYNIGNNFREPTRNDMFAGMDNYEPDIIANPNPTLDIKPERVINQELGLRFTAPRQILNCNVFYMDFKNERALSGQFGPNGLALTTNVDKSYRTGVEVDYNIVLTNFLSFHNQSVYMVSKIIQGAQSFSPVLTPDMVINQHINFFFRKFAFSVSGRYQSESFLNFANSHKLKPYFLLNTSLTYNAKRFKISIFGNNLLNKQYFTGGYVDYNGTDRYFIQAPVNYMIQFSIQL